MKKAPLYIEDWILYIPTYYEKTIEDQQGNTFWTEMVEISRKGYTIENNKFKEI